MRGLTLNDARSASACHLSWQESATPCRQWSDLGLGQSADSEPVRLPRTQEEGRKQGEREMRMRMKAMEAHGFHLYSGSSVLVRYEGHLMIIVMLKRTSSGDVLRREGVKASCEE